MGTGYNRVVIPVVVTAAIVAAWALTRKEARPRYTGRAR